MYLLLIEASQPKNKGHQIFLLKTYDNMLVRNLCLAQRLKILSVHKYFFFAKSLSFKTSRLPDHSIHLWLDLDISKYKTHTFAYF